MARPRRYRNRRIGDFLKELDITEGRGTGIPKILHAMKENGSPAPVFEFDEDHSFFMVRLPVHAEVGRQATQQVTPQHGDVSKSLSANNLCLAIKAVSDAAPQVTMQVTMQVAMQVQKMLEGMEQNDLSREELQQLTGAWKAFKGGLEPLPDADPATSVTREKWLLPLFEELK